MKNDYLNIQESAVFTGKVASTIRRALSKLEDKEKAQVVKYEKVKGSGGEKILIKKSWLSSRFGVIDQEKEAPPMPTHEKEDSPPMPMHAYALEEARKKEIELLKLRAEDKELQIERLYKQLEIKDKHLEKAQEQNSGLLERIRESNLLLGVLREELNQLKERAFLPPEPEQEPEEELQQEPKEEPLEKPPEEKPAEKKGFWLYIFIVVALTTAILLAILQQNGF